MKTISFLHAGDMGDIISSLSVVRDICAKESAKAILYLDITGGMLFDEKNLIQKQSRGKYNKFNRNGYNFLRPLLVEQSYIEDVREFDKDQKIDYNLNLFREHFMNAESRKKTGANLARLHRVTFGLDVDNFKTPVLDNIIASPIKENKEIVSRSTRLQSAHIIRDSVSVYLDKNGLFVGTDLEYNAYKDAFMSGISRVYVENALEAERLIASAPRVWTSDSLFFWIAWGINHPAIITELGIGVTSSYFKDAENICYIQGLTVAGNRKLISANYNSEKPVDKSLEK